MTESTQRPADLTKDAPGLLPLIPMLYIAWSDGILTPAEIETIRAKLQKETWLNEHEQEILARWLDPSSPPSPAQLLNWLKLIRKTAASIAAPEKKSLAELGLEISRIGAKSAAQRCTSPEACAALAVVEQALGVVSTEAAHELVLEAIKSRPDPSEKTSKPSFKTQQLQRLLDGKYAQIRTRMKTLLSDREFIYQYGLSKDAYRERVYAWCLELARQGFGALSYPEAAGGKNDLGAFMAAFETLAFHDLSLSIKFGVQFGLFGGSILNLGTEQHHKRYLKKVGTLELPGCFAMTELGHGSNVRDIGTVARYDPESEAFVIHTPSEQARKDYIGNAALHGRMATVFAQLEIADEKYGVHAFLVPIRDDDSTPLPGIKIEDCGEKMGLNGVDNGRLWFDQVRIPRENLLNRFAEVSQDGAYSSPISSASQRFFTMLGTLVGGRVSISAAGSSAAKSALTIAIRYALKRRQFGAAGEAETLIMDYPSHQRRLLPLLARAYAIHFAQAHLAQRYSARTDEDAREIEGLAAALKAYSSWNATETIQACREACGGQGYLAVNRFSSLKADTDVFSTFEGDNTVLMQLVAKGLLTEYKQQFSDMNLFTVVKLIAKQTSTAVSELNPVVTRMTDEEHLRDSEFQIGAFQYREQRLLATVARRIKNRLDNGVDSYIAFIDCQDHLIRLALAHAERIVLEQFLAVLETVKELQPVLKRLCDLYALSRMEHDRGWFLENGYIEGGKAKAIRRQVERLCLELRPDARYLVDAFGIPDECLAAPIAFL